MIGFIYLCLVLFIIIFILYLFKKNIRSSPKKIKLFMTMALAPLLLRFLVLMCAIIIEKQSIIYMLRPFVFLNFFSNPLLIIGCLFIFLRDEKVKFNINYIFLSILLVGYCSLIMFYKIDININTTFGFVLNIRQMLMPTLVYLIIIGLLTVFTMLFIDKPHSNKFGMRILIVSLIVVILEQVFFIGGIKSFPYPIIGEIFILFSTFKAIETFNVISKK
ncbi:hypothetical protein KPL40_12610 [Clostridium gasigenes]|nr:hypothetical protein [Clostridium gasigenes]